jgi:hypothetical protein
MPCNARENQKTTPHPREIQRGVQVQTGTTLPKTEHWQNKLTVGQMDVTSADHSKRILRPGPNQNLEKEAKPNFQRMFTGRSPAQ